MMIQNGNALSVDKRYIGKENEDQLITGRIMKGRWFFIFTDRFWY
jgi:hypothetical protein